MKFLQKYRAGFGRLNLAFALFAALAMQSVMATPPTAVDQIKAAITAGQTDATTIAVAAVIALWAIWAIWLTRRKG